MHGIRLYVMPLYSVEIKSIKFHNVETDKSLSLRFSCRKHTSFKAFANTLSDYSWHQDNVGYLLLYFLIIYVQHFSVILEQSLNFLLAHNVVVVIFEPLTIFNCDFLTQLYRTNSLFPLVPTKKNTKICYFLLTNTCSKHTHPNIMGVYIPPPNDKDDGDKRNRIPTPTPTNQPLIIITVRFYNYIYPKPSFLNSTKSQSWFNMGPINSSI